MEEIDFPAANSMDTLWFAVDQAGHVGVFFSGESGPAPLDAEQESLQEFLQHVPGIPPEMTDPESEAWQIDSVHEYGLFLYEADPMQENPLPLQPQYERLGTPDNPIHVDQLAPHGRSLAKRYRFDTLRFADTEIIQIFEHMACQVDTDFMAGYLCADGKTVKPIPGKEEEFAAFVEMLLRDFAEESAGLVFEGIEPPKKKKRPPRKKKDEEK